MSRRKQSNPRQIKRKFFPPSFLHTSRLPLPPREVSVLPAGTSTGTWQRSVDRTDADSAAAARAAATALTLHYCRSGSIPPRASICKVFFFPKGRQIERARSFSFTPLPPRSKVPKLSQVIWVACCVGSSFFPSPVDTRAHIQGHARKKGERFLKSARRGITSECCGQSPLILDGKGRRSCSM